MPRLRPDALSGLVQTFGSDGAGELVAAFRSDLPAVLDAIRLSLLDHDQATLRRQAHTIKSSCRLLKAVELANRCEALERSASQGRDMADLALPAEQMALHYAQLIDDLVRQHAMAEPARGSSGGST